MFVLASTCRRKLEALRMQLLIYKAEYSHLLKKHNKLVDDLNAKGGKAFLYGPQTRLDSEDIKRLLILCHPDKHDGKRLAVEMTQKLLAMRT